MITVGIDEVGRGCWAGPLVAAAVVLDKPILGLRDSKVLSKKRREELADIIKTEALAIGYGWVWPGNIDTSGITIAVKRAMEQALAAISTPYDDVIVDGHINYLVDVPGSRAVIRADDLFPSVSAASIVAKVARDAYMIEMDQTFPGYGFAAHVGYGTASHVAALHRLGVTDIHRRSFKPIRALLE